MRQSGVLNFCCATFETESQPSNSSLAAARKICRVVSSASCGCKQSTHRHTPSLAKSSLFKKIGTLLDLCVSSLRRGHANLLCIVPILSDDPRRESGKWCISYVHVVPAQVERDPVHSVRYGRQRGKSTSLLVQKQSLGLGQRR